MPTKGLILQGTYAPSAEARELRAIARSGGEPTPGSELERFLGSHPTAKTFLTTQTQAEQ